MIVTQKHAPGVGISKVMLLRLSYIRTCSWCQIYPEAMLLALVTQEHAPWWQNIQVMLLVLVKQAHAPGVRISKSCYLGLAILEHASGVRYTLKPCY